VLFVFSVLLIFIMDNDMMEVDQDLVDVDVTPDQGGDGQPIDIGNHLEITPNGTRFSPKFGMNFNLFKVNTRDLEVTFAQVPAMIMLILDYVKEEVLKDVPDNSWVRLKIENKSLRIPIWTPPIVKTQITVERWMDLVMRVLQSCETFALDDGFEVEVQHAVPPGGGCPKNVPLLLRQDLAKRKSIVQIKNKDNLCMARALAMGQAYADRNMIRYNVLRRPGKPQSKAAKELIEKAGLERRMYTIKDIPKFEAVSLRVYVCSCVVLSTAKRGVFFW
jgi:hypothetical protein